MNNIVSFYSGTPFSVTASGTSLNAPENDQRADQVKSDVAILGGIGPTSAYFDPLAFAPVTEARFGTAPFNVLRGPGVASWDLGIFRQFDLPRDHGPARSAWRRSTSRTGRGSAIPGGTSPTCD